MSAFLVRQGILGLAFSVTCCGVATAATVKIPPGTPVALANAGFEAGTGNNAGGSINSLKFSELNTKGVGWDVFNGLSGWTMAGNARVEIQSNRSSAINAHSGSYFISLDTQGKSGNSGPGNSGNSNGNGNNGNGGNGNSGNGNSGNSPTNNAISQNVTLKAGTYLLSFWYSPESTLASTNTVSYNLGRLVSGQVPKVGQGVQYGIWTQVQAKFTVLTGASYSLQFASLGTADGVGGFIDDVSIVTAVPVPAAGVGLLGALGLLTGLRKRRARTA